LLLNIWSIFESEKIQTRRISVIINPRYTHFISIFRINISNLLRLDTLILSFLQCNIELNQSEKIIGHVHQANSCIYSLEIPVIQVHTIHGVFHKCKNVFNSSPDFWFLLVTFLLLCWQGIIPISLFVYEAFNSLIYTHLLNWFTPVSTVCINGFTCIFLL